MLRFRLPRSACLLVLAALLWAPLGARLEVSAGLSRPAASNAGASAAAAPWTIEDVEATKTFSEMRDRSLALDAAGRPHVAYGGDHLYYARYDGAAWQVQTADSGWDVGRYAALALDAAGRPHIAYRDDAGARLRYAYHDGAAWHVEVVAVAGSS